MVNSIWAESNGGSKPLPAPNVVVANPLDQPSPEGILLNPIYTGVGPFPRLVEDATWVRACVKLIAEEGPEQFLVNLLFVLRECLPAESKGRSRPHT
jgi:hypothetical protein